MRYFYFAVVIFSVFLLPRVLSAQTAAEGSGFLGYPTAEEEPLFEPLPGQELEKPPTVMEIFDSLPEDIQEEIITESQKAAASCSQSIRFASLHDCECIAGRFLEERVLRGPEVPHAKLLTDINKSCVSRTNIAGYIYSRCIQMRLYDKLTDQELEDLCTCNARKVTNDKLRGSNPDLRMFDRYVSDAYRECKDELRLR